MKDYVFKYYQTKKKALLADFDNPESLPDAEAIHKLRVDIKKIRAVFYFFEVIAPKKFKASQRDVFKRIFKYAGLIREIQVNLQYLDQYKLNLTDRKLYIQEAELKENNLRIEFIKTLKDFDFKKFSETSRRIKKLCKKTRRKKIVSHSKKFLFNEAKNIEQLEGAPETIDNTHKTRKHLKSFDTIATLLVGLTQNERLSKLLSRIKKIQVLLGDWHDKVVLTNSLEEFLEEKEKSSKRKFASVKKIIILLNRENQEQLKKIHPKIRSLPADTNLILEKI